MSQNKMTCNGVPSAFSPSSFMWQIQSLHEGNHQPTNSVIPTNPFSNPQDFRGAMVGKRSRSFSGVEACDGEDDILDEEWHSGEKKRRLNLEQVRTLEKSFETGSRLEPERKMQLARALGLRPRQIAIWFQNRRARWKTKQLEKDYDALKKQFDALKSENESLQAQNKKLQAEISALKGREASEPINLNKEIEGSCSNRSENSCGINLDISRAADSTLNSKQCRSLFRSFRPGSTNQLLHNSEIQCPKIESTPQDEGFGNLFCNMDDQSAFWSWSENHNFH